MKKSLALYWPRWLLIVIPFALLCITAITYYPSLHYAFQFDDGPNIVNFYHIRHKTFTNLFFTSSRWISCWINTIHYQLGLFEPFFYRQSNLIFHCLVGLILFFLLIFLLRRLPIKSWFAQQAYLIATVTSALFLLHPVQTQTVSYVIQGQLEGLSALFCLLIISSFLFVTTRTKTWQKMAASILLFITCVIATGTKEITIIVPILVLFIDWFFIAQGSWQALKSRWWIHTLVFSTIIGCYIWLLGKNFLLNILTLKIEHQNNIGNIITPIAGQKITTGPFFISQFKVILHYLYIFIWPCALCIDYDWRICSSFDAVDCILPLLVLIGIFISIVLALRKNRTSPYAFGMLWFFICLAPRSTIMPSTELLADYKTYLASIGWLFILAMTLVWLYQWAKQRYHWLAYPIVYLSLSITGITLLSVLTYERNKIWQSGVSFWADVVCKSPNKARGYNNYGMHLFSEKNDLTQAIWCFKRAIALEPTTYPDPYNNLSAAYATQERIDLAIATLRQSLKINPRQPKTFNNLGIYLMQKQQDDWAEKAFLQAISLYPPYGLAYYNLGRLYARQNKQELAWQQFKNACTQADFDTNPMALQTYARTSFQLQKYEDATHGFVMLLKLAPNDHETHLELGNTYLVRKRYADAINCYQRLMRDQPHDVRSWCNCTEAYAVQQLPVQALEIICKCERENRQFPGIIVQKARCLHMLGKSAQAKVLLLKYLKQGVENEYLKTVARNILKKIEQA